VTSLLQLYIINLEGATGRLVRLRKQFSRIGLGFVRIEAVDACALSKAQCRDMQNRNIWSQPLTRGEIACFLSHGRALEQLIADNVSHGVIFEDDITLGKEAATLLQNADWLIKMAEKTGEEIDIIKLETAGKKVWLGQDLPLEDLSRSGFALKKLKSTHIMAAAYLVSRAAAMRLLEMMTEKAAPFDHFLFNFSLGNAQKFALYQLDPAIAVQAGLESSLEGERSYDKKRLKSQRRFDQTLAREARRLIRRAKTGLWGLKTNFFTHDQWKRVPFIGD